MSKLTKRQQQKINSEKKSRKRARASVAFSLLIGCMLPIVFNQWVAPLLPGPSASVEVLGLRPDKGNGIGCIFYSFELSVDEPIDSAYIKIALPHSIKGAKVGYPAESIFGTSESAKMQVWEMGRDLGGECDVIQAAINSTEGVSFVATANVLAIRTSNLEARGAISGAIAVTSFDSAMRSEDPIFEGSYQYTKWGIPVRRKLSFHYAGVKDAK